MCWAQGVGQITLRSLLVACSLHKAMGKGPQRHPGQGKGKDKAKGKAMGQGKGKVPSWGGGKGKGMGDKDKGKPTDDGQDKGKDKGKDKNTWKDKGEGADGRDDPSNVSEVGSHDSDYTSTAGLSLEVADLQAETSHIQEAIFGRYSPHGGTIGHSRLLFLHNQAITRILSANPSLAADVYRMHPDMRDALLSRPDRYPSSALN